MNKLKLTFAIGILLASISCANLTVLHSEQRSQPNPSTGEKSVRVNSFFWGLVGREALDEADGCGVDSFAKVEVAMTTTDVLLSAFTLGFYLPHHAKFTCRRAPGLK